MKVKIGEIDGHPLWFVIFANEMHIAKKYMMLKFNLPIYTHKDTLNEYRKLGFSAHLHRSYVYDSYYQVYDCAPLDFFPALEGRLKSLQERGVNIKMPFEKIRLIAMRELLKETKNEK